MECLNLFAMTASPVPANYHSALADPNWRTAMAKEYNALITNNTWRLVPRPSGANVVTRKWLFRHKYHSNGSLARHKARWVVRGFSQQAGVDYDETFSRLSNRRRSAPSSASPPHAPGPFISWT